MNLQITLKIEPPSKEGPNIKQASVEVRTSIGSVTPQLIASVQFPTSWKVLTPWLYMDPVALDKVRSFLKDLHNNGKISEDDYDFLADGIGIGTAPWKVYAAYVTKSIRGRFAVTEKQPPQILDNNQLSYIFKPNKKIPQTGLSYLTNGSLQFVVDGPPERILKSELVLIVRFNLTFWNHHSRQTLPAGITFAGSIAARIIPPDGRLIHAWRSNPSEASAETLASKIQVVTKFQLDQLKYIDLKSTRGDMRAHILETGPGILQAIHKYWNGPVWDRIKQHNPNSDKSPLYAMLKSEDIFYFLQLASGNSAKDRNRSRTYNILNNTFSKWLAYSSI